MQNNTSSTTGRPERFDVVVVDGTNFVHRCHHALSQTQMASADGTPVWALHGTVGYLAKLVRRFQPNKLIVAFDVNGCPSRKLIAPGYKQGRSEPDVSLVAQLAAAPDLFAAAGISVGAIVDWEADDVCATVATKAAARGLRTAVVSSDKDCHQLIGDATCVVKPEGLVFDDAALHAKWGVRGSRWVEYAALIGEKSDNLPGVTGIGAKRAVAMIDAFDDVEAAFENLDVVESVAGRAAAKAISEGVDTFRRNREVATLRRDLEVGVTGRIPDPGVVRDVFSAAGLQGAGAGLANAIASLH